jgi:hypothetical protein
MVRGCVFFCLFLFANSIRNNFQNHLGDGSSHRGAQGVPTFMTYSTLNQGTLQGEPVTLSLTDDHDGLLPFVSATPLRPIRASHGFSAAAFSYAPGIWSKAGTWIAAVTTQTAPRNQLVRFSFGSPPVAFPASLYAFQWGPGVYTIQNGVRAWTVLSCNDPSLVSGATITVPLGKKFSGILRWPGGSDVIEFRMTKMESTSNIEFTLAYIAPIITTTTPAPLRTTTAAWTAYHTLETAWNGDLKCYQIPSQLYGIHMPELEWLVGPCDKSIYARGDCWFNMNWAKGITYFVYRFWAANATCPDSGCCCNPPVGATYGSCTSTSCLAQAASSYPNPTGSAAANWVPPCSK